MLLLDMSAIATLIAKVGLRDFYLQLCDRLRQDFSRWNDFQKSPRHAEYVTNGVIELMPICDEDYYAFKYVNGHPHNPVHNKLSVVALGMLADVHSGYPLMISAMTELTALRTAATSALASSYLARPGSRCLAIIGCGAQSEFQVLAHHALFNLSEVRYLDIDPIAMQRFAHNLKGESFTLKPMTQVISAITDADIIITATASKRKHHVLEQTWVQPGQHISGIGGDSPGKTELDPELLRLAKIVVEYFPQTHYEGEIQNLGKAARDYVYAELWEVIVGDKPGRTHDQDITLFDSVGFALEDYSILCLCYQLAQVHQLGKSIELIPQHMTDCKNLYGLLIGESM